MCKVNNGFRVVITGKGGVGKTTLTSCLAAVMARGGTRILAVDEDPQMNLPYALGLGVERAARIVPLNQNRQYIEEKTGIDGGKSGWGAMFKLNPDVDDVVERFGVRVEENLDLLVMGTVKQAGGGCLCAENVMLDSVMRHLALRENEGILLDTQAGVEHFGRALAKGFSHCLVVSDDTFNALSVACHSASLARQTGIPMVCLIVNRASERTAEKLGRFQEETGTDFAKLFNGTLQLPVETMLPEMEPGVTAITGFAASGYAAAVFDLASRLRASACGCSSAAAQR